MAFGTQDEPDEVMNEINMTPFVGRKTSTGTVQTLGCCWQLDEPDISNPVASPASKPRLDALSFERNRSRTKKRRLHVVECVDVHDGVEVLIKRAGNQGDDAASRTNMKLGGVRPKRIS
jgi:hypothetical protein